MRIRESAMAEIEGGRERERGKGGKREIGERGRGDGGGTEEEPGRGRERGRGKREMERGGGKWKGKRVGEDLNPLDVAPIGCRQLADLICFVLQLCVCALSVCACMHLPIHASIRTLS